LLPLLALPAFREGAMEGKQKVKRMLVRIHIGSRFEKELWTLVYEQLRPSSISKVKPKPRKSNVGKLSTGYSSYFARGA